MKNPIQSAGEAVPSFSLTASIHRYRAEWNGYLAATLEASERGQSDDLPYTYEPAAQIIKDWNRPAEHVQEALLALELALEDYEAGDTPRIPAMMKAALGYLNAEPSVRKPPPLAADTFSIKDLVHLYRVLDNLEEAANMADQYLRHISSDRSKAADYIEQLGEYLSAERVNVVDALRSHPHTNDRDGQSRLATIIQYEAWCEEFRSETVSQFATSVLSTKTL